MPIFSFLGVALAATLYSAAFGQSEPAPPRVVRVHSPPVVFTQTQYVPVAVPVPVFPAAPMLTQCLVDAGPLWSNVHAQSACHTVCGARGGSFTGQWRTTRWGSMSVCQCTFASNGYCPPSSAF